eukprot:706327-Pleurochrysis_carterae.AAC.2
MLPPAVEELEEDLGNSNEVLIIEDSPLQALSARTLLLSTSPRVKRVWHTLSATRTAPTHARAPLSEASCPCRPQSRCSIALNYFARVPRGDWRFSCNADRSPANHLNHEDDCTIAVIIIMG